MAMFQNSNEWGGPRIAYTAAPYAVLTFSSELGWRSSPPSALADETAALVRAFLTDKSHACDEASLASEVSFLYVVLGRPLRDHDAPVLDSNGPFVEYGHGEFPAAPEGWASEPLGVLLRRAIRELKTQ